MGQQNQLIKMSRPYLRTRRSVTACGNFSIRYSFGATTNRYATTDLEMKRKAIEQAQAIDHTTDDGSALWRTEASILAWLEAL
jgi:hypothetical protein